MKVRRPKYAVYILSNRYFVLHQCSHTIYTCHALVENDSSLEVLRLVPGGGQRMVPSVSEILSINDRAACGSCFSFQLHLQEAILFYQSSEV